MFYFKKIKIIERIGVGAGMCKMLVILYNGKEAIFFSLILQSVCFDWLLKSRGLYTLQVFAAYTAIDAQQYVT